jgi:hypothetical protein
LVLALEINALRNTKFLLAEAIVVEPFSLLVKNRLLIALIYIPSGVPSNSQIFILYVSLRSLSKGEFVFPSDETGVATAHNNFSVGR